VVTKGFAPALAALNGSVTVPGSKSESNRALVCASLANGESRLHGVADGDDTERMLAAVALLGAEVDSKDRMVRVRGPIDRSSTASVVLDAGLAGTTSRFLTAVAALRRGRTTVTGEAGLQARPMGELHRLVRELGAVLESSREGFLPVSVQGIERDHVQRGSSERVLTARGDVSSQFISAVMMVAPLLGGVRIRIDGDVVSRDYLEMTSTVMQAFGATVDVGKNEIHVWGGEYRATEFFVDADWSSASYAFAAAAIAGGSVRVPHLRMESSQPEAGFVGVLEAVGCSVRDLGGEQGVVVSRDPSVGLRGAEFDMASMSDLVPTLAVIAACAETPTVIRGVGFIRAKESDRLGDLAAELQQCGAKVAVLPDGLRIEPNGLRTAVISPHDDHRLAMSLSLLGLRTSGITVKDHAVVSKSWPHFWTAMSTGLGVGLVESL